MSNDKRFVLISDSCQWNIIDTKSKIIGGYNASISKEDVVDLLNKFYEELLPFYNLADDYNLDLNMLYDICVDTIENETKEC